MNTLHFLTEQIKTGSWDDRRVACRRLAVLGDAAAVHPLLYALDDQDASVREAAFTALGELNHPLAAGPMMEHLERETETSVRLAAIQALGKLRNPNAVPSLARLLNDEAPNIRMASARALGTIRDIRALNSLSTCLEDLNLYVRAAACQSMGQLENAGAIRQLIQMLGDVEPLVREKSLEALDRLGENRLVDAYERAFFGEQADVSAVRSLARQGDIRMVSPLLKRMEHPFTENDKKDRLAEVLRAIHEAGDSALTLFLCAEHLERFVALEKYLEDGRRIAYWGCRTCCDALHVVAAQVVTVVIDERMQAHRQDTDGELRINWFNREELFDFNRVEIGVADDKTITRFCMMLHNDTDMGRLIKPGQMSCNVWSGSGINQNTLQILRQTFARVGVF